MLGNIGNVPFRLALLLIGAVLIFIGSVTSFNSSFISFTIEDIWIRIMLIILGLISVGRAIFFETEAKSVVSKVVEEKSPSNGGDNKLPYDKFSEYDERKFLDEIELSDVRRLFVLGHTGKSLYETVHKKLETLIAGHEGKFPEEIRVLIRAPIVESLRRNHHIQSTIDNVNSLRNKNKNIDVRFYESIPAFRGIICEYRTKEKGRDSFITSYYWREPNTSKAFDHAYISNEKTDSSKAGTRILESWINQYWGKDEIHTVVFDFDDTLVKTREIQVKAWAQVIFECLRDKIIKTENLSNKFRVWVSQKSDKSAADPILLKTIENIFVDKQLAEAIAHDIFVEVQDETIKQINKRRFEIRESMMGDVEFFEGVEDMLKELYENYNLAIISSTDEELISEFLRKKGSQKYFPVILGKKDPSLRLERENIYHKSSLLIKLSEIIGMPLSRLVYIGDNNSDYLATSQLGIAFIEARQAAKLVGKESIIRDIDSNKPPLGYFETFKSDQLLDILKKHSENLTRNKYKSGDR